MNRLGASLVLAGGGALMLLAGLSWDLYLHTQNPGLAHTESLLTLSNPGHALSLAGTALTVTGIALAILSAPWGRTFRFAAAGLIAATALSATGVVAWASRVTDQEEAAASLAAASQDRQVAGQGAAGTAAAGITTHLHGAADPSKATPAERAAAQLLLEQTRLATRQFADLKVALAAGYRAVTPPGEPIVHYVNPVFLRGPDTLNPQQPESLIYGTSVKGPVLLAAMYIAHGIGQAGPDIGGPLTLWHSHSNLCFSGKTGIIDAFTDAAGNCPAGDFNTGTPEMLHVWVVDNPNGPFSTDMNPQALISILQTGVPG